MLNKKYKKRLSEGFYPPPKRNRVAAIITTGEINNTNKDEAATKADLLAIITTINHNAAILDDIMIQVEKIEEREKTTAAAVDLHQGVAHWIHTKESKIYYEHWKCSNCTHDILENPRFKNINEEGVSLDFKYCPYCGSRMEEEIKENTATEDQD